MKAPTWSDGTLIVGPQVTLCTSEKEWAAILASMNCKPTTDWLNPGADATTHFFTGDAGGTRNVVCIRTQPDSPSTAIAALLVHEAVHIWQGYCESIGEQNPSIEFEAYGIQMLSQYLFNAYSKRIRKARK